VKILISGSSGTIGKKLSSELVKEGNEVIRLVRRPAQSQNEISWNPSKKEIHGNLEGFDAFINLAGAPIAKGRWSNDRKKMLLDSRRETASLLSETISNLKNPPKTYISASAAGIYGERGKEVLSENSAKGTGFLSDLSSLWEQASQKFKRPDTRIVNVRLGNVLSEDGGILKTMAPIFKVGGGAPMGTSKQYISWISEDDAVNGIKFLLSHPEVKGAVNLTSPNPVTNREFSKSLGQSLHRPVCPVSTPGFVVRTAMGQQGKELMLHSTRAVPNKLTSAGYKFKYPDIQEALNKYAPQAAKKADDL
jgi:uncharacterized protein